MCESKAYIRRPDGTEELLLEDVAEIKPKDGKLYLRNIFSEEKVFDGEIEEISLTNHKIILKPSSR